MSTPTRKCGLVFHPCLSLDNEDHHKEYLSNFLIVVLEKFPVTVQQYLLIYVKLRKMQATKQVNK